ncbi:MAG: hypothetical protein WBH47_04630, partial [Streptosporangiaceae bacterium]
QLGAATGLTFLHRIGTVAVWPAAAAWAVTCGALVVSVAARAVRAGRARRAGQTGQARRAGRGRTVPRRLSSRSRPHPLRADRAVGPRRYTFEAVITIPPPDGNLPAIVPGPDWHGIIRASTERDGSPPRLFSAVVADWDARGANPAHRARAVATIVAFGPRPADCLPVGGTFALWRGHDVAHGVVTRRIFV